MTVCGVLVLVSIDNVVVGAEEIASELVNCGKLS